VIDRIESWHWIIDLSWLLFLIGLLFYFWRDRQNLKRTQSWLLTKGRITEFLWTQEDHRLWPKIEYTYSASNQEFQGSHLFLDTSHNNSNSTYARRIAYRAALAYERDEEIDVYYNPANPQESALDITIPRKLNLILFLLLMLIFFHVSILIYRLF
jgi:hypothetical protein